MWCWDKLDLSVEMLGDTWWKGWCWWDGKDGVRTNLDTNYGLVSWYGRLGLISELRDIGGC